MHDGAIGESQELLFALVETGNCNISTEFFNPVMALIVRQWSTDQTGGLLMSN